jgi:hypothetical protein
VSSRRLCTRALIVAAVGSSGKWKVEIGMRLFPYERDVLNGVVRTKRTPEPIR